VFPSGPVKSLLGSLSPTTRTPMKRLVKNELIFYDSRLKRTVSHANASKSVFDPMTAFNSKWKIEKLAVVVHVP